MNITYESSEKAVHRIAPNLQSFARKERYSVTSKGRPKLTTRSNVGTLPGRTEPPPRATQIGPKSPFCARGEWKGLAWSLSALIIIIIIKKSLW